MSDRLCPDCRIPINPDVVQGVHLDACGQCGGVWFDDGELTEVQNRGAIGEVEDTFVPSMERWTGGGATRQCPVCHDTVMAEYNYMYSTPVRIDACPNCHGIWVQDGELRAMERLAAAAQQEQVSDALLDEVELQREMVEHERKVSRLTHLSRLIRVLTLRRPYH